MVVVVQLPWRNAALTLFPCVLSNTAHLPVQLQYTKPAQINRGPDSKIKSQCAGNTQNALILANRPRSDARV